MDRAQQLAELVGAVSLREVSAGHQSRVFEGSNATDGGLIVVKLLDAALVDRTLVEARAEVVAELGVLDPAVCKPLPLRGQLVTDMTFEGGDAGLVTCYEFAAGSMMAATHPADARLMGLTLARLHRAMREANAGDLPSVAALQIPGTEFAGPIQLLHGDFNSGNLRQLDGVVRVFDFDDCGTGPALFDVANALYMELFNAMTGGSMESYRRFEQAFLSGYCDVSGRVVDRRDLSALIDHRVVALEAWLDAPALAPVGIRAATPAWHGVLRSFILSYRASNPLSA